MKKIILFNLVAFLFSQAPPSFTLNQINVEGNLSTSDNMILYTSGLKNGQKASTEDFRRAVKRLWDLGVFNNILIHFDGETPEGISQRWDDCKRLADKKYELLLPALIQIIEENRLVLCRN